MDVATVEVFLDIERAAVVSHSFRAEPGERLLGFGERSHLFSLNQGVLENYVGEGLFQPHEYPFLTDAVPPWGVHNRPDGTISPIPWVLSSRGFGPLLDQDDLSYERFRTDLDLRRRCAELLGDRVDRGAEGSSLSRKGSFAR